jgi:hypothetical protein
VGVARGRDLAPQTTRCLGYTNRRHRGDGGELELAESEKSGKEMARWGGGGADLCLLCIPFHLTLNSIVLQSRLSAGRKGEEVEDEEGLLTFLPRHPLRRDQIWSRTSRETAERRERGGTGGRVNREKSKSLTSFASFFFFVFFEEEEVPGIPAKGSYPEGGKYSACSCNNFSRFSFALKISSSLRFKISIDFK